MTTEKTPLVSQQRSVANGPAEKRADVRAEKLADELAAKPADGAATEPIDGCFPGDKKAAGAEMVMPSCAVKNLQHSSAGANDLCRRGY